MSINEADTCGKYVLTQVETLEQSPISLLSNPSLIGDSFWLRGGRDLSSGSRCVW